MLLDLDRAFWRNRPGAVLKAAEGRLGNAESFCKIFRRNALFQAITTQNFVSGWHRDTYGIGARAGMSIHHVSDYAPRPQYHFRMSEKVHEWSGWGRRFRAQIKEKDLSLAAVAAKMIPPDSDEPLAESTLRSWTNGTRNINLSDVFWLCEVAGVDPAIVLFGRPLMTDAQRRAIGELTTSLLESDPTASPGYEKFGDTVRKSVRARKAAEARAVSRLKT